MDCLFCKIINKEIPANIVYEDDLVLAFKDINPSAPVHILIIPKQHIGSILEVDDNNMDIVVHIHKVAKKLAKDLKIDEKGFRLVTNCGDDAGQSVKHLHYHLIGGKVLLWAH
jgi:histidine triad (HIT) family protein